MNNKKLFTKALSISLTAAMVLTMAPISPLAKNTAKVKSIKAPKSSTIKVGQTKTIEATRKATKTTKDVKYVRFSPKNTKNIGISVKSSDDAIVSVKKINNGKYEYTGVNTGTATLTITSRAKTAKGKKLKTKLDISVINPFAVKQTGAYTFTMSTADKLDKVDKRDIKVTQEGSIVDNAVKEVKIAEDKMSVEVKMEVPFVDQKKYEVEFGKEKGSFVASVGAPAAINIKTQQVVQNKPTEVEYSIVDAKGMDVTAVLDKARITVEVKANTGNYDVTSKKLTLVKVGDTAEATVTYHSWTYDKDTGKENVIEGKVTITCVDKSSVTVTGLDKWTIADRILSWDTDDMKSTIAEGKKGKIWVRMKKSDGTYVDNKENAADFAFEPINTATLYAYSNGEIFATRAGVEYVKVTYFDGTVKYQYTLPVTVGAKAKATRVVLSHPFVTIASKNTTVPTIITMKVLDQYGEAIKQSGLEEAQYMSGSKVAAIAQLSGFDGWSKDGTIAKIGVKGNATEGTGVYKLTAKAGTDSLNITLTVNARDVSSITANDYMLKAEMDEFDVTLRKDTKADAAEEITEGITLDLYATKAGLISDKANAKMNLATAEFTVNGVKKIPADKTVLKKNDDGQLIFSPVVKDGNGQYISLLKAGVYTIRVKFEDGGKTYVSSTSVVVKNETAKAEKDKSYELGKVKATEATKYEDIAKAIVDKTGDTANTVAEGTLTNNSVVLAIKDGKATKVPSGEGIGKIKTLNALKSEVYIDTAVLPAFRLDDGGATVWVLEERLNQKVDVILPIDVGTTLTNTIEGGAAKLYYGKGITYTAAAKVRLESNDKEIEDMSVSLDDFEVSGTNSDKYDVTFVTKEKVTGNKKALDVKFNISLKPGKEADAADEVKVRYVRHITGTLPAAATGNLITLTEVKVSAVEIPAGTNAYAANLQGVGVDVIATVTGTGLTQLANVNQLYNKDKWGLIAGTTDGHDTMTVDKAVQEEEPTDNQVKVKLTIKQAEGKTVQNGKQAKVQTKNLAGNASTASDTVHEITVIAD